MTQVIEGIGVGAGSAVGSLVQVVGAPTPPSNEPAQTDVAVAIEKINSVLEAVAVSFEAKIPLASDAAKPILQAGAMMARDPGLASGISTELAKGVGLATAVYAAAEQFAALFESLGGYMAERVSDIRDVRDRAVARLLGQPEPGVPVLEVPSILAARDLAPAETATLDPAMCLGIVTAEGGPTSHTAILAAQLGIPAVVQATGILSIAAGTLVAVDGSSGRVIINPTTDEQGELERRRLRRQQALSSAQGVGETKDGYQVPLLANIGTLEDAKAAAGVAVEGVGLFRTEFLFLDRADAPSLAEQTQIYTEVLQLFGGRRVTVRTLDAGADKPLQFADLGAEENPALGRRGLRLSMRCPELIDTQLAALAAAQQATGADLRVMAPMVATQAETQWFVTRARQVGIAKAGVMIEIPAAAIRSKGILYHADFASLGTNDLSQYTMAADRMQGELADLLTPWEPALLDVVALACQGGQEMGKPVGVCGEAGGDPMLALVLVGLGVRSLSMAPAKVAAVRTALAHHTLTRCQQLAAAARAAVSASQAREAVLAQADPIILDLI